MPVPDRLALARMSDAALRELSDTELDELASQGFEPLRPPSGATVLDCRTHPAIVTEKYRRAGR